MDAQGEFQRPGNSDAGFRSDLGPNLLIADPHGPCAASLRSLKSEMKLDDPVFPQQPKLLTGSVENVIREPHISPARRHWSAPLIYRALRGWMFPYIQSRLLAGEFHIAAFGGLVLVAAAFAAPPFRRANKNRPSR